MMRATYILALLKQHGELSVDQLMEALRDSPCWPYWPNLRRVYRSLDRLEQRGLIASRWEVGAPGMRPMLYRIINKETYDDAPNKMEPGDR